MFMALLPPLSPLQKVELTTVVAVVWSPSCELTIHLFFPRRRVGFFHLIAL